MQVHQLAKSLNTTPDTVRYYTRIGLLNPDKNEKNAYKYYSTDEQARLRFILCARQMDFSVDEIRQILAQAEQVDQPCADIAVLIERKLAEAQLRLKQTISLKKSLHSALVEWQSHRVAPTGGMLADVITRFAEPEPG